MNFHISEDRAQILRTKTLRPDNMQYDITIEMLNDFIRKNQTLSALLYEYRDKLN